MNRRRLGKSYGLPATTHDKQINRKINVPFERNRLNANTHMRPPSGHPKTCRGTILHLPVFNLRMRMRDTCVNEM